MRSAASSWLFLGGAFVATLLSSRVDAFCLASTCAEGQVCGPPPWDDPTCKALAWVRPCVSVSLEVRASKKVPLDVAEPLVMQAFAAWESPLCDAEGGRPNIHVINMGTVSCDLVEYNSKGGNANVVTFRDATWPHPSGPHNIALTTVTFDTKTGEIYDADMEINSSSFELTNGDADVQTDLLSVVTHEAGHFLGMAHSEIATATMFPSYTPGTVDARSLSPDDVSAICQTYPPATTPVDTNTCNPIPRHGFSPACLSKQTEGDCSVHAGDAGGSGDTKAPLVITLGLLVGLVRLRRSTTNRNARRAP